MIYSDKLIEFINKYDYIYKYLHEVYNLSFIIIGFIIVYLAFKLVYEKIKLDNKNYRIPSWSKFSIYILLMMASISFVAESSIQKSLEDSFYNSISLFQNRVETVYSKNKSIDDVKVESDIFKEQMDIFIDKVSNTSFNDRMKLYTSNVDTSIVRANSLDKK